VKERPVAFGPTRSLSGILTEPPGGAAGRPGVLLLNAGFLHRVGPNRLYVMLARRLAAAGLPVLRFDYSGLGESEPRRDELTLEQSMLAEGVEAMNFLQAEGVAERFVPMGLCAGAEQSQRLAHADARVVGAVLIDGYAYRTAGYYLREYGHHLASARSWRRLLARPLKLRRYLGGAGAGGAAGAAPVSNPGGVDFVREFPSREDCLAQLQAVLARAVDLFLVFTGGGMAEFYNSPRQFHETFPSLRGHPRIRLDFMPLADHTFTLRSQQDAVLASIDAWARTTLLAGEADVAPGPLEVAEGA
jgi:pimeloyl-ACP methyl ester carboxylesterase